MLGFRLSHGAIVAVATASLCVLVAQDTPGISLKNSLGAKIVRIAPGTLRMGNALATDYRALGQHVLLTRGDFDETPVHEVRLPRDFYISETEITVAAEAAAFWCAGSRSVA